MRTSTLSTVHLKRVKERVTGILKRDTAVKIVDWLSIEKDTGDVVLTLVDDLDWSDVHAHLLALQEKLNTRWRD
jgi:hypothetical protein